MKEILVNQYKENIPRELQDCPQWILFQKVPRINRFGETKIAKIPMNALTLSANDWNSKKMWTSFEVALYVLVHSKADGLVFVLSSDAPFVCIDLDHCIAMTGNVDSKHSKGSTTLTDYDKELNQLYRDYAPRTQTIALSEVPTSTGELPDARTIIETMCRFNHRARDLFYGSNLSGDWSKDDFGLLLFLNSFTHGNEELMKEIFLQSALNRMGDTSKRKTEVAYLRYLESSIQKAI